MCGVSPTKNVLLLSVVIVQKTANPCRMENISEYCRRAAAYSIKYAHVAFQTIYGVVKRICG